MRGLSPDDMIAEEVLGDDAPAGADEASEKTILDDAAPCDVAPSSLVDCVLDGRYVVTSFLARGGMGAVYRAEQLNLGRDVALKVLNVRAREGGETEVGSFRRRFETEAALAASFSHPHVTTVHDFGCTEEGVFFIAMEYLEGRTVRQDIRLNGPLGGTRVVHIALQACAALGALHERGLIHRDLKPSNLMLIDSRRDRDYLKLLDFGLVKQLSDAGDRAGLTKPGSLVGSPGFLPPEQILQRPLSPATDIYALGAVMFYMASGSAPFSRRSEYEVIRAHLESEPPALREVNPAHDVPNSFESVIRKCLAKEPGDRYQSMLDLAEAILLCEEDLLGLSPRPSTRPGALPAPEPSAASPRELLIRLTPSAETPTGRASWALAAGIVLAGVLAGLYLAL